MQPVLWDFGEVRGWFSCLVGLGVSGWGEQGDRVHPCRQWGGIWVQGRGLRFGTGAGGTSCGFLSPEMAFQMDNPIVEVKRVH